MSVDYEQVYAESARTIHHQSGFNSLAQVEKEAHESALAAVVNAAKADALEDAAQDLAGLFVRNPKPDINNPAHVRAAHMVEAADKLHARAKDYREEPDGN